MDEKPYTADPEFWARHERATQSRIRKDAIRDEVKLALASLVEKYTSDEFDSRKDIAWYFEQFGKDLRGDMDKEKARERAKASISE